MSTMGLIPFCSTFAVFAGRSYDQIRNGVCYPHFNVKFGLLPCGRDRGRGRRHPSGYRGYRPHARSAGHDRDRVPATPTRPTRPWKRPPQIDGPVYLRLARLATTVFDPMPFEVGKGNVHAGRQGRGHLRLRPHGGAVPDGGGTAQGTGQGSWRSINLHTIKPLDSELVAAPMRPKCKQRLHGGGALRHRRPGRRGGRRAGGQRANIPSPRSAWRISSARAARPWTCCGPTTCVRIRFAARIAAKI